MSGRYPPNLEFILEAMPNFPYGMDMPTRRPITYLESAVKDLDRFNQQEIGQQYNMGKLMQLIRPDMDLNKIYQMVRQKWLMDQMKDADFTRAMQMNEFNVKQRRNLGIDPKLPYKDSGREWWM